MSYLSCQTSQTSPSIFQRTIEGILRRIPHVCLYLDDILVTGNTEDEHLRTLNQVLERLEAVGLRLKQYKCASMLPSLEYLGHTISADRLRPSQKKVRDIMQAPKPHNVSQLWAILGLLNYYGKFLPQLSSTLAPQYRLLEKQNRRNWGPALDIAFEAANLSLPPCTL